MTVDEMVGGITDSMDMSLSKLWEMVKDTSWGHTELDTDNRLNNSIVQKTPIRKRAVVLLNWKILLQSKATNAAFIPSFSPYFFPILLSYASLSLDRFLLYCIPLFYSI